MKSWALLLYEDIDSLNLRSLILWSKEEMIKFIERVADKILLEKL